MNLVKSRRALIALTTLVALGIGLWLAFTYIGQGGVVSAQEAGVAARGERDKLLQDLTSGTVLFLEIRTSQASPRVCRTLWRSRGG